MFLIEIFLGIVGGLIVGVLFFLLSFWSCIMPAAVILNKKDKSLWVTAWGVFLLLIGVGLLLILPIGLFENELSVQVGISALVAEMVLIFWHIKILKQND